MRNLEIVKLISICIIAVIKSEGAVAENEENKPTESIKESEQKSTDSEDEDTEISSSNAYNGSMEDMNKDFSFDSADLSEMFRELEVGSSDDKKMNFKFIKFILKFRLSFLNHI